MLILTIIYVCGGDRQFSSSVSSSYIEIGDVVLIMHILALDSWAADG